MLFTLYTLKTKRLFLTQKQLVQYQQLITVILTVFQLKITVIKNIRSFLTEKMVRNNRYKQLILDQLFFINN